MSRCHPVFCLIIAVSARGAERVYRALRLKREAFLSLISPVSAGSMMYTVYGIESEMQIL